MKCTTWMVESENGMGDKKVIFMIQMEMMYQFLWLSKTRVPHLIVPKLYFHTRPHLLSQISGTSTYEYTIILPCYWMEKHYVIESKIVSL